MVVLKSATGLRRMRESGKILGEILHTLHEKTVPGVTPIELNNIAESIMSKYGVIGAFKNYRGFPYSICLSKNEVLVHGIPNNIMLTNDDIVTIDSGVIKNGYFSDAAFTKNLSSDKEKNNLLTITKKCLYSAIDVCVKECKVGDISYTIQNTAETNGYNVIKNYGGHGIGKDLHEFPFVPNYGIAQRGWQLKIGTAIAIEPILTRGTHQTQVCDDGWTVTTLDNNVTAHFEHTVFITGNGPEILTNYE